MPAPQPPITRTMTLHGHLPPRKSLTKKNLLFLKVLDPRSIKCSEISPNFTHGFWQMMDNTQHSPSISSVLPEQRGVCRQAPHLAS